jgi:tRNA-Thr(GGU) m(6)t(6)A37 methyltransferase TsaA
MSIVVEPVAHVRSSRGSAEDDFWGETTAIIELREGFEAESLVGLADFSHAEIVYVFDRVSSDRIVTGKRHPRNNKAWPAVGIFAQRGKNRPNRIGTTIVRVLEVIGRELHVAELDAIDGTPVLDIKPLIREFLPRTSVLQPDWATEIMADYWSNQS